MKKGNSQHSGREFNQTSRQAPDLDLLGLNPTESGLKFKKISPTYKHRCLFPSNLRLSASICGQNPPRQKQKFTKRTHLTNRRLSDETSGFLHFSNLRNEKTNPFLQHKCSRQSHRAGFTHVIGRRRESLPVAAGPARKFFLIPLPYIPLPSTKLRPQNFSFHLLLSTHSLL